MTGILPNNKSQHILSNIREDEHLCSKAIKSICGKHGFPHNRIKRCSGGSTIVYNVDSKYVIKLFSPAYTIDCQREESALRHIEGRLKIPTPKIVATGELDGWPYVVMTRLHGQLLSDVWDFVSSKDRLRLCEELGQILAQLHAIPTENLDLFRMNWADFVSGQYKACIKRQAQVGLNKAWLDSLPSWLETLDIKSCAECPKQVFLHTEIMRQHLFVENTSLGWQYTGLFDFEPAMLGDPAYDFASVSLFISGGDPHLLSAVLKGYGHTFANAPDKFMTYALLHKYSNFKWYLEIAPPFRQTYSWNDLKNAWFTPMKQSC